LETSGNDDYIRPWLWVVALFLGPIFVSICFQWYIYIGTRTLARTQGIITELVFEHSLRIRFKAESSNEKDSTISQAVTPAETPDTGSIEESTAAVDSSDSESTRSQSTTAKGKSKAGSTTTEGSAKEKKKKDNLIGKINTLVTVDVDNIIGSKDFLMLGTSAFMWFTQNFECLIFKISCSGSLRNGPFRHFPIYCSRMEVRPECYSSQQQI
jgi:hypothetical protein